MPTPYIMIKTEVDVTEIRYIHSIWLRRRDLNPRPSGYEHLFALIVSSRILQKTLENTDFFAYLLLAF